MILSGNDKKQYDIIYYPQYIVELLKSKYFLILVVLSLVSG